MYLHQEEREQVIAQLAEQFPKAFFVNPDCRLPLKKNIVDDIARMGVFDTQELLLVHDYYVHDFTYQRQLLAGAARIDLNGAKCGTVTEAEQRMARNAIEARKLELARRKAAEAASVKVKYVRESPSPIAVVSRLNGAAAMAKADTPPLHPALAEMQSAMQAAFAALNPILTEKKFEPLRAMLAASVVQTISASVEKLVKEIT
jgi:sRNA-binding protein